MRRYLLLIAVAVLVSVPPAARGQSPAAPKIEFVQPQDRATVATEQTRVVAKISDPAGVAAIVLRVNGERVPGVTPPADAPAEMTLDTMVPLSVGENVIGITATNKSGRIAQAVRTVTRSPAVATGPRPAAPRPPPPRPKHELYAIVIGVGSYDDPAIPRLPFAENDALAMYEFLTTSGGYKKENVTLVTDAAKNPPTSRNVRRAFDDARKRAGKDDTVLVYYAGYGAPEIDAGPGAKNVDGLAKYLIPKDTDPASLFSTAVSLEDIEAFQARFTAERVIFVFDVSFSGQSGGRTFTRQSTRSGLLTSEFMERLARTKGHVTIYASAPNQNAYELPDAKHGLFTYYLLEGMRGPADADRDGIVTLNELFTYVQPRVTDRATKQHNARQSPMMKGAVGDLPFVPVPKK